jgi:hypothetical protein
MKYEFHPEALEEYRQAALWYAEASQGLRCTLSPQSKMQ